MEKYFVRDWFNDPVELRVDRYTHSCEIVFTKPLKDIELVERNGYTELKWSPFKRIKIEKVIFNPPATIVFWNDGDKTVVKCDKDDKFDKEKGLAMAISKYFFGNKSNFNDEFKKFIGQDYD